MRIAIIGAGHIGFTVGTLWQKRGHDLTFAARDLVEAQKVADSLKGAKAAPVADAVRGADVVLVAVPGPAVVEALEAAGDLAGKVVIDAANFMGADPTRLADLVARFPRARFVRAFNTIQAGVLAKDNHRKPEWTLFLSGDDAEAKKTVAKLIDDAGFAPFDLGSAADSVLQDPGSSLWNNPMTLEDAEALVARVLSGDASASDPLTAPFEKLRDHLPADPAFFFSHLCRAVFQAGMNSRIVDAKWPGLVAAFHGFDPERVARMTEADIDKVEHDPAVIRNGAKLDATVSNAKTLLAMIEQFGGLRRYFASFENAAALATDLEDRFKFLGEASVWRLVTSAARDIPE